jgi:hypothetical protein
MYKWVKNVGGKEIEITIIGIHCKACKVIKAGREQEKKRKRAENQEEVKSR